MTVLFDDTVAIVENDFRIKLTIYTVQGKILSSTPLEELPSDICESSVCERRCLAVS